MPGQFELPMENAYCEECYFYCEAGMNFELDVDLGAYYYPYVDKLKIEIYGEAKASAYIRITNPAEGKSDVTELTDAIELPSIAIPIGPVILVLYPGIQLLAQVEVVESSMDATLFGGFTASMSFISYLLLLLLHYFT